MNSPTPELLKHIKGMKIIKVTKVVIFSVKKFIFIMKLGNRGEITQIRFSQDNENFAVSSTDKTIMLYSLFKKNTRRLIFNLDFEVFDFDLSIKNIFGAVGNSKKVTIHEAVLHNGFHEDIVAHQSNIRSFHFSSSGNRFITGSDDKSIKM